MGSLLLSITLLAMDVKQQMYVSRIIYCDHGPACPLVDTHIRVVHEKAWVVWPGLVITSPNHKDQSEWATNELLGRWNQDNKHRAMWLSRDPLMQINTYIIDPDVPVSDHKSIPKLIRLSLIPLSNWIAEKGGLDYLMNNILGQEI